MITRGRCCMIRWFGITTRVCRCDPGMTSFSISLYVRKNDKGSALNEMADHIRCAFVGRGRT